MATSSISSVVSNRVCSSLPTRQVWKRLRRSFSACTLVTTQMRCSTIHNDAMHERASDEYRKTTPLILSFTHRERRLFWERQRLSILFLAAPIAVYSLGRTGSTKKCPRRRSAECDVIDTRLIYILSQPLRFVLKNSDEHVVECRAPFPICCECTAHPRFAGLCPVGLLSERSLVVSSQCRWHANVLRKIPDHTCVLMLVTFRQTGS